MGACRFGHACHKVTIVLPRLGVRYGHTDHRNERQAPMTGFEQILMMVWRLASGAPRKNRRG